MKVENYFRLAKKIAIKKNDCRQYRLGAVGIRSDGIVVTSSNIPSRYQHNHAHAESRLVRKLNSGSIIFVVRILRCGKFTMARPCLKCQCAMRKRNVKRVYYSIGNKEYGILDL
jgi:tRNA(Arg) A34 adenosine deaminase TadA